jgi:hypothetical protein
MPSDARFALLRVKKAHGELLQVLDSPEVQRELDEDQRDALRAAERTLSELRENFAEALAHMRDGV